MQMYMEQLQYLDNEKDVQQKLNEENQVKLKEFLQKELEKKDSLNQEITKLEERTSKLNETRNDLFRQLNEMEKTIEAKINEKNELKA